MISVRLPSVRTTARPVGSWLVSVVRSLVHASRDPIVRYRTLWFAAALSVDVVLIGIGVGYAFFGGHATPYPEAFRVLRLFIPFGLYGHGVVMTVLGMFNFWGLGQLSRGQNRRTWRLVNWTERAILFYSLVVMFCMLGAVWLTGRYQAGFWYYLGFAVLTGAVVSLPPPFRSRIGASEVDCA